MKIFKVVPAADTVVLQNKEIPQNAVVRYFDIINQECVNGWEFVAISPITVTKRLGKLRTKKETYNAFIFSKDAE